MLSIRIFLFLFLNCWASANVGPRGQCHSRGSQPSREVGFILGKRVLRRPSHPPSPFSAVMNLRLALEFPPKNQILFPTSTRDCVGASFKEAHKSTTWWIETLNRVGIPQLNNFPALSSPFLLHRLHYISSLIPSQIPTNGRSFKPFRWNKVKSKQNKTIYFQFLPYCFFPRKLLN